MSLRQMEYLLAVVEEGSFTRAAQRLAVSQPTLSHQVRALERSVGQPLLERLQDNVRLTPMGRAYLPHAIATLRSAQEAWSTGRPGERGKKISLRVAAVYSVALGLIPQAIRVWLRSYPAADIEVLEFANFNDMSDRMALGIADVAVGPLPPEWDGPVRELGHDELVVVLASDDPFAGGGRRTVRLADLAGRPWVLYAAENGLTAVVSRACARAGFIPRPAVRTYHTATALRLAAAGLGPALIPKGIIRTDFNGAQLDPDPPICRRRVAITSSQSDEHVTAFVDLLAQAGRERFLDP